MILADFGLKLIGVFTCFEPLQISLKVLQSSGLLGMHDFFLRIYVVLSHPKLLLTTKKNIMDQILAQIQPFGFNFAPKGWMQCNGQILSIAQYNALFSLLGTSFGGNGTTTFALPDLRGRTMLHYGTGPGLSTISFGEMSGTENVTITNAQMPAHLHGLINGQAHVTVSATDNSSDSNETSGGTNGLGTSGTMPNIYREGITSSDQLGGVSISGTTSVTGGNSPVGIRNHYLGVIICIAIQGIYTSRT